MEQARQVSRQSLTHLIDTVIHVKIQESCTFPNAPFPTVLRSLNSSMVGSVLEGTKGGGW